MDASITVRPATPDDVDAIVDVHLQGRTAYYAAGGYAAESLSDPTARRERLAGWAGAIGSPRRSVWCATRQRRVVGILAMGRPDSPALDDGSVGQLYQIHVLPECWGAGIGSRLHDTFTANLRDASLSTGLLEVWQRNTRAQGFYLKHGWRPDGERRPGPDGADYLIFRLHQPPAVS